MQTPQKRIHEVAQPVLVAEVFIFHGNSLLMNKRSETKKKFPGFWSIPGGHIDEGEDPLAAAIREVKEETGISIFAKDLKLKVVALHHHLDRQEMYVSFSFHVILSEKPEILESTEEGTNHWIDCDKITTMGNVFPPVKLDFERIVKNEAGIIYEYSDWNNNQLVGMTSETVDSGI